jgi:hypothetical protein
MRNDFCRLTGALTLAIAMVAWTLETAKPAFGAGIGHASRSISVDRVPSIFDIIVDPSDLGSVLLATRGGLYRARRDGRAERISRSKIILRSLSLEQGPGKRLYALGLAEDGRSEPFLLSSDHGRSWRAIAPESLKLANLYLIETSRASSRLIYGAGYAFWTSADGGSLWTAVAGPKARIIDLAASAFDARRIFAATMSGLRVSDDGGFSWRPAGGSKCSQPVTAVDTGADGTVYAFSLCTGLLRGDEVEDSWAVVNNRFGGCIIRHLAVDPRDSARLYAVIRCRKVIVSADRGVTWRALGATTEWEPNCPTNPDGVVESES